MIATVGRLMPSLGFFQMLVNALPFKEGASGNNTPPFLECCLPQTVLQKSVRACVEDEPVGQLESPGHGIKAALPLIIHMDYRLKGAWANVIVWSGEIEI